MPIGVGPILTTAPWSEIEGIGEKSRKVYWQFDCPICGGFLSAGVVKNRKALDDVRAYGWAWHRQVLCPVRTSIHKETT